jgi:hypothetical protein
MSNDIDYTRLPRHELNEYFGLTIWNGRSIRSRNDTKKRAAISAVGSNVTPAYRRKRRIRNKARKAIRNAEIAAFNKRTNP